MKKVKDAGMMTVCAIILSLLFSGFALLALLVEGARGLMEQMDRFSRKRKIQA